MIDLESLFRKFVFKSGACWELPQQLVLWLISLHYYKKSYQLWYKMDDYVGIADTLNLLGAIYDYNGKYSKALKNYKTELINLKKGLESAASILTEGGRLVVIAYHSLEDRIVKEFFNSRNGNGFTPLSRKVIKPSREEVLSNRRSRSARLRCAEFSLLVN